MLVAIGGAQKFQLFRRIRGRSAVYVSISRSVKSYKILKAYFYGYFVPTMNDYVQKRPKVHTHPSELMIFFRFKRTYGIYIFKTAMRFPENNCREVPRTDRDIFKKSGFREVPMTDIYIYIPLTIVNLLPRGRRLTAVLAGDPRIYGRPKGQPMFVRQMIYIPVLLDIGQNEIYLKYILAQVCNWERKRPVWVMLMVNSLTESDIRSRGVPVLDLYLAQEAERLHKHTGAVERVEEQCVPLNELNFSQVVFALNHTLSQQEILRDGDARVSYTTDDLIQHYNCGDLDAVIFSQDTTQVPHLGNASLPPVEAATATHIDDYFREELIYRRNQRMGERVVDIINSNPEQSFFFAFGAGHFLGNHTVLDVVKANGLNVQHVSPEQRLKRHKRRRGGSNHRGGVVPELSVLKDFTLNTNLMDANHQQDPAFARFLSEQNRRRGQPITSAPSRKHAHFNDLWVRIDPQPPDPDKVISPYDEDGSSTGGSSREDAKLVEESLRVWYGLPTAPAATGGSTTAHLPVAILKIRTLSVLPHPLPML
ncbi:unnamed protein product, partial [Meganyctiphanes norvegica]